MFEGPSLLYRNRRKTLHCLGRTAPLELADGRIKLHVLVDRTSIEVFANAGAATLKVNGQPVSATLAFVRSQLRREHFAWLRSLKAQMSLRDVLLFHGSPHLDTEYLLRDVRRAGGFALHAAHALGHRVV